MRSKIARSAPITASTNDIFSLTLKSGHLEVRLAKDRFEIKAAQKLRYEVFYEEMGAIASPKELALRIDRDDFDDEADHLLVIDRKLRESNSDSSLYPVVGTYRLLRRPNNGFRSDFYTEKEYDISKLTSFPGKIMELGRSCVDTRYRNRTTMQLLWQGIAAYIFHYNIDLMFGCASFPGDDPEEHTQALGYLESFHQAPDLLCPKALPSRRVNIDLESAPLLCPKIAFYNLPPLIIGYLRLGGWVGEGAVIDHQFNTTDVCIVVKTECLPNRYHKHYLRTARTDALQ